MGRRSMMVTLIAVLMVCLVGLSSVASAADEKKDQEKKPTQFMGLLSYRTGPFAAGGSGFFSGMEDFMQLRNMQGGVNGVMYEWAECETAYNVARAIECYERFKDKNILIHPMSTGITYALIDRAAKDNIAIISSGYGRSDASDGTVFPYVFTAPTNYWSQNTAKIKFIGERMGGMDKLKGLKIANLHIDLPYGQETKPILDGLAKKYGFIVKHYPVSWPGIDQKAQWMDIVRRFKADWVINRNYGVSCTVPLKEAARLNFPRDRILGVWWCGSEDDVLPAGKAAKGYIAGNFHGVGRDYPIIQDIIDKVYGNMKGNISMVRVGTVFYNRGVVAAIMNEEAIRTAQKKFGNRPITGKELQWGMEHLEITPERIKELGAENLMMPLKITPQDHEGGGKVRFQQWDGEKWVAITGWVEPMKEYVWDFVKKSSAKYAKEKGIEPRKVGSEKKD
jgi:branched-chain amino acid transport system substrate-binding protein